MTEKNKKLSIYILLIAVVALCIFFVREFIFWTSDKTENESVLSQEEISDTTDEQPPADLNPNENVSNNTNESEMIHDEEAVREVLSALSKRDIRVLLYDTNYSSVYHEIIKITSDVDFTIQTENSIKEYSAGDVVTLTSGTYENDYTVFVKPTDNTGKIELLSVTRAQGIPQYSGFFEITQKEKGLCIVNEVDIETYLYSVVPSEMPSYYPLEALKAQAISARTYAYERMLHSDLKDFNADVSDSSNHQVYNNIEWQETTNRAVDETKGMFMFYGDTLAKTYYYSTSCGIGADEEVWSMSNISYLNNSDISVSGYRQLAVEAGNMQGDSDLLQNTMNYSDETVFREWIELSSLETDSFEKNENYYRWNYTVTVNPDVIYDRIKDRKNNGDGSITCTKDTFVNPGSITNIEVIKRAASGYAMTLSIEGENASYVINGQNNIRYILCNSLSSVVTNNGSLAKCEKLIPSAFFVVTNTVENGIVLEYTLTGGGHGHGVGMSQNGAKNMADMGMSYNDILDFFYQGTMLIEVV